MAAHDGPCGTWVRCCLIGRAIAGVLERLECFVVCVHVLNLFKGVRVEHSGFVAAANVVHCSLELGQRLLMVFRDGELLNGH